MRGSGALDEDGDVFGRGGQQTGACAPCVVLWEEGCEGGCATRRTEWRERTRRPLRCTLAPPATVAVAATSGQSHDRLAGFCVAVRMDGWMRGGLVSIKHECSRPAGAPTACTPHSAVRRPPLRAPKLTANGTACRTRGRRPATRSSWGRRRRARFGLLGEIAASIGQDRPERHAPPSKAFVAFTGGETFHPNEACPSPKRVHARTCRHWAGWLLARCANRRHNMQ